MGGQGEGGKSYLRRKWKKRKSPRLAFVPGPFGKRAEGGKVSCGGGGRGYGEG